MQTQSITMTKMLNVTGISSRHVYLDWEAQLGLTPPRNAQGHRMFPPELVANLQALKQLLDEIDMELAEWLRWEGALRLFINRDEWRAPKLAADSYYGKYLGTLKADLAEATVNLDEFLRWEHELDLSYPNDARGNRTLTRDWKRYLQTVQEKYAEGWTVERVVYNIKTPNEVRPQLAYAGAGPEY